MAGSIPVGSLVTDVKLNGSQPVTTLKELKQAVSGATSAWRAQEAVLKSAGKQTEAAKAKYAGLTETVKNQRKYIEALAEKQKNLKKVQAEADQTTEKGKQAYKNATEEIQKNAAQTLRATTRLESLTKQQEKAKSSLNYYKSGLADAQKSLKQTQAVARSYIERLQAEGRQYEANKTRLATYRTSIENLTKQQKLQADELVRIGKASGEASEAYKRQQIRLNQTSTTLAKTKNEMNELSSSMQKANPSVFDRFKNKLGSVNKEAGQTHKTFKEVFAGSVVGNAVSNAVSNLTGKLKGAVSEGMALNAATAKINARFKSMGMSTKGIETLDKQIGDLKAQTNMTGDNVANLQTKMLNWSNISTKGAMQMTKMIAGVGDSSKLSGDQIEQMGASLMRVGSTGKVTYSALNRVTKSAPTFMAQLAKGAGMSEDKLKSVLKTGKVTQTQFQKWMAAAGKYSDTVFKGFSSTQAGAIKYMQVRWQKLEQTMTKPLFDAKTSGLQSLKDIMSSPELLKGATAIGNALSSTLGYIDKHKKDIAGITSDITHIAVQLGKDVWKDISGIIGDIGKSFGLIHGNTKKTEDPLHMVKLTMDGLAKNKTAIQWISKAIIAMAAVKGLKAVTSPLVGLANIKIGDKSLIGMLAKGGFKFGKGMLHPIKSITNTWDKFLIHLSNGKTRVGKITDAFKTGFSKIGKFGQSSWKVISKAWGKASDLGSKAGKGIVKGLKATGHGLASAGKWSWSKIKSGFGTARSFGQTLGKQLVAGFKKSVQISKGLFTQKGGAGPLNGLLQSAHSAGGFKDLTAAGKVGTATAGVGVAVDAAASIVKGIKDKVGSRKQYEDIGTGAGKAIGGGIGLWFGGPLGAAIGAKIGGVVGKWGGDAVKSFQNGWNKKKPPKNFWSLKNLGWSTHDMFNKIGKWGGQVGKKFGQSLNKGKSWVKKNSKELALTAVNPIAGIPTLLYKNNPKFRKWANGVAKNIKGGLNKAKKSITGFKNSVNKNFKKAWDSAYKHASKGTKQIMRSTEKFAKNYVKINKKANSETVKNFSSFGKRLKKNHGDLFKIIGQTAKKQLAIEKKRWSSNWKNIKTTAQGIWKGLNRNASDMYKKLNSATHGGLGKVLNGFKSFGKGISSFWSNLWKGIEKFFSGIWDKIIDKIDDAKKSLSHLHIGGIHFANGTDWRNKYGVPAVVNDAPGENYREGLLVNGKVVPFPAKRNLPIWLMPGQDIINGDDMAKHFGSALHYASGTVHLSKNKYSKKNYELAKKRAIEDKKELEKLGDKISNALKRKNGDEARHLTAEFNKLTKKYSADKKAAKKPDPHAGKVLVDQGLLIGAKSRIGHSVYISKDLFKKLIANLNKKKSTTRRCTTTHKRRSTTARRTSTRRYSSRVTTPRISSGVSARISTVGLGSINGLSKALKGIKSKSIKVVAKASGTKAVASLAKSVGKVKGGSHKVRVKTSGTKGLKSLQKNITSVHKRIDSLSKASKKDKFGKAIAKQAEEAVKSLKGKGNFAKQFNSMVKKFEKDLKAMVKTAQKEFKSMWSNMEHSSKTSQSSMLHSLSSFSKKFKHDWSSLQGGVYKSFSHFWTNMRSAAGRGVNNVIRILNSAIGKIDNVISDFGGSKTAVSKSSLVHYAEGTDANGRLTRDTLAIVNDAKSGPRQEAIVTDKNDVILPKGNNVPVMLRKGWGVLNGAQTQRLGLPHFADGTGLSLKRLYEIAKHNWNNPTKTGNSMFSAVSGLTGAMKELASGMRSKSKDQGVTWWSQLWKMVEDKVDDDDLGPASGLLKAVETLGKNKHYSQGKRMSKFFADCSSLVSRALYNDYGAKWAEPNGWALTVAGLWDHAHRISKSEAKPGDPVFWLPDTHVGIYAGRGMYYSAYGPGDGGPVGMQRVASGATFGRFNGLNTEGSKSDNPKVKANTTLQKKIKAQVGQGLWKTIQKIADKYGDNGLAGAFKLGGDVAQRAKALAKAIKQAVPGATKNGLAAIIGSWEFESGGLNPKAINSSSGASGFGQWLGGRLVNLKEYARRHGKSWTDPATQINFAATQEGSDSAIFKQIARGSGSAGELANKFSRLWERGGYDAQHVSAAVQIARALRGYANGGIATRASIFGEAGPEMAIPLIPSKSTRAWELIGKAIAILSANTTFGQQQNQIDAKEQKEEHEFRQSVLLLLRQLVNKSSVADIKLTTPAGRTLWEVVEPFSKAEQRAAMIKLRRGLSGR